MNFDTTNHPEHLYLVGAGVFLALIALTYSVNQGPLAKLPGPWYTKWTKLVLEYNWLMGNRTYYVHNLHKKYGPVVRLSPNDVDICDVEAKQQIYTVKETFRKSPWYQRLVGPTINSIFSTQDIDFHRRHRRLLSAPLSESSLKGVEPIIRDRVDLAMQRVGEEMKTRGAADVFKWSLFMATDIIGELTFGTSFQMLEKGEENQYITDLETVGIAGSIRAVFPRLVTFLAYNKYHIKTPIPALSNALTSSRNLRRYAQESLERYHKEVESDPENVKPSLFTKMFKEREEDTLSFNEIRDTAQTYIVAGSDTTAHTLTYLLWAVCKRPEIRDRLVKEVETLREDFSAHDAMELPYLNQVIEETLRMFSAAPSALPRIVPSEGATIAGHFLPGGVSVSTQAYSLHRSPDVFPNPDEFDPDRWAAPTKPMKDSFLAFGGGARVCIGLHLARAELRLAAALFFRMYPNSTVSTAEGMSDEDMNTYIYFISSPKGKRCLIDAR